MTSVLIMAGGQSSRMRASGRTQHKALRQVNGVSLLEHNLRAARSFGFTDVHIAVNQCETQLLDVLREHPACADLNVLVEQESLGTIGVAARLRSLGDSLVVLNVDNLSRIDLRALVDCHQSSAAAMTVATHQESFQVPLGEVSVHNGQVAAYREKPLHEVTISSGTNVLSPLAVSLLAPEQRADVPQLVARLLDAGHRVSAYEHNDSWIDVNDSEALQRAHELPAGTPLTLHHADVVGAQT